MFSTLAISKHSEAGGHFAGTHQQLDRAARRILKKTFPKKSMKFPTTDQILHFEGNNGPDGLKAKSPGIDEPVHFIDPKNDDGKLRQLLRDHQYNLKAALKNDNPERAAFEATWLAHALTDGLTPPHHFPFQEAQDELMTEKEFIKIIGQPIKGIMHGRTLPETLKNNWIFWIREGYMTNHIAFECAIIALATTFPEKAYAPKLTEDDFKEKDIDKIFDNALKKVTDLDMYTEFRALGWTPTLGVEARTILLPEIIKAIALAWNSAL